MKKRNESTERKIEEEFELGLEPRSPDAHDLSHTHPKQGMEELGSPDASHYFLLYPLL